MTENSEYDSFFDDIDEESHAEEVWLELTSDPAALRMKMKDIINQIAKEDNELDTKNPDHKKLIVERAHEKISNLYQVSIEEARLAVENANQHIESQGGRQGFPARYGGQSKKKSKLDSMMEESLPMLGELIDNIFDNFEKSRRDQENRDAEELGDLEVELSFHEAQQSPEIYSYIRIRENSGGIDEEIAQNLFVSADSPKEDDPNAIGIFNSGMKLALPHFGYWHEIQTYRLGDERVDETDGRVGLVWRTGSDAEPNGRDPDSTEQADYWADENRVMGAPPAYYLAKPGKLWTTRSRGRTEITIRRLNQHGLRMVKDNERFNELVRFLQIVWSPKISGYMNDSRNPANVTFKLIHAAEEFRPLTISTKEEGLDFIDMTSEDYIYEKLLYIPDVTPRKFSQTIETADSPPLKITWIAGVQRGFKGKFPDDKRLDFLNYKDDPYAGFYFFGNGRLFERAYQPDLNEYFSKRAITLHGRGQKTVREKQIELKKSQTGYFVVIVIFEGPANLIPFHGPVKWKVNTSKTHYKHAISTGVLLARGANNLMYHVQNIGATDAFRMGVDPDYYNGGEEE